MKVDPKKIIAGKRILIVDDEEDILDSLVGLLEICKIDTALSFEEGRDFLEAREYDAAILDIMGVKGFELLEIANQQGIPALMLTAHALSVEAMKKSAENGAAYYAPKDKITEIDRFLADVIEASEKKKNSWVKWFQRLSSYYDRKFGGTDWREKEKEFWKERIKPFS
jgi:DNA-binding response OmpR family regulator